MRDANCHDHVGVGRGCWKRTVRNNHKRKGGGSARAVRSARSASHLEPGLFLAIFLPGIDFVVVQHLIRYVYHKLEKRQQPIVRLIGRSTSLVFGIVSLDFLAVQVSEYIYWPNSEREKKRRRREVDKKRERGRKKETFRRQRHHQSLMMALTPKRLFLSLSLSLLVYLSSPPFFLALTIGSINIFWKMRVSSKELFSTLKVQVSVQFCIRSSSSCSSSWWLIVVRLACRQFSGSGEALGASGRFCVLSTVTMLHESHPPRWMQLDAKSVGPP